MTKPHSPSNNPNILGEAPDSDEVGMVVRVAGEVTTTPSGGSSAVDVTDRDARILGRVKIWDGTDVVLVTAAGELLALVTQGTSPWVIGDGGGSITIDGSVSITGTPTVDTELPAAAALSDATANPTSPMVGAALMAFDDVDFERLRFRIATPVATDRGLVTRDFEQALAAGAFALRTDDTGTVTYVGNAVPGSLTSGAVWRIRRVTESGVAPNTDYTIEFADGDNLFNNIWDNRLILAYS